MEVLLGENAGFCFGVKRAVDGSIEKSKSGKKTYCLGDLVHNSQVISELKNLGVTFIDSLEDIQENNSQVIVRAHGVPKEIYEIAKDRNLELIDFTCPFVFKVQEIAREYNEKDFFIIITGKPNHPEIIGIKSYCDDFSIISDVEEVSDALNCFIDSNKNKLLLISQTTFSVQKFSNICQNIEANLPDNVEFVVNNTICNITDTRQKETGKLAKDADMMIIIGGKNSSNTKKLFEVAKQNCENSLCIESKVELNNVNFKGLKKVGIMAGASTPPKAINEVIDFLKEKN